MTQITGRSYCSHEVEKSPRFDAGCFIRRDHYRLGDRVNGRWCLEWRGMVVFADSALVLLSSTQKKHKSHRLSQQNIASMRSIETKKPGDR